MRCTLRLLVATLAATAGAANAGTIVRTWPSADAPCNGTLQACIDGVPDTTQLTLVPTAPIDESLEIEDRSIELRAADGRRVRFAPMRTLRVNGTATAGDLAVTLRGLDFTDATVSLSYGGTGTGTFRVERVHVTRSTPTAPVAALQIHAYGGTLAADVRESRFEGRPANDDSLLTLSAHGAQLDATVAWNHFSAPAGTSGTGAGLAVDYRGYTGVDTSGRMALHGNVLRGDFGRAAMLLSEGAIAGSPAAGYDALAYNNVVIGPPGGGTSTSGGTGILLVPRSGRIDAQVINNTLVRVARGVVADAWSGSTATAAVEGVVANNLVVGHLGLGFSTGVLAEVPDNHHNLLNVTTNSATPGPSTVLQPARLVAPDNPRLRPDSPAIDAADSGLLGFGLIFAGLPILDADGLRRLVSPGPTTRADIGAYESDGSGFVHVSTAGNTDYHRTRIDHPLLDNQPAARLFATPMRNLDQPGAGVPYPPPYGVSYVAGDARWWLFAQNAAAMPVGARMHAYLPQPGDGLLRHRSSSANTLAGRNFTRLEASGLDGLADRILLVQQVYFAGSSVFNTHHVGVVFDGTHWSIDNLDNAAMPVDALFDVYYQAPSPNAFRVVPAIDAMRVAIPHPLLDGNPCARPMVTRQMPPATLVATGFDVVYDGGGWHVASLGTGFAHGTQFHVRVDAPNAASCGVPLFADGFEAD